MQQGNNPELELNWIIGIIVGFAVLVLLIILISFFQEFFHELKYINREIKRSEGKERRHWVRKRRRLWLSLLPFVKY